MSFHSEPIRINFIPGNSESGISLRNSYGNTNYNNYLKNSNNVAGPVTSGSPVEFSKVVSGNVRNTTKTTGMKIIEGSYLSGVLSILAVFVSSR